MANIKRRCAAVHSRRGQGALRMKIFPAKCVHARLTARALHTRVNSIPVEIYPHVAMCVTC